APGVDAVAVGPGSGQARQAQHQQRHEGPLQAAGGFARQRPAAHRDALLPAQERGFLFFVEGDAARGIQIFGQRLGLRILQGYGQTETSPSVSVNRPHGFKLHTVGPPLKGVQVRIADDGEILVKGELVMKGYWNNEAATRETIRDGWVHTGDIGLIDADGHLQITDRKKDIIVNSGGDNVSPQRVEGMLTMEPEIAQAMVYGDKHPHLVGLVVPDAEWLAAWAAANGKPAALRDLAEDGDLLKVLTAAVERVNGGLSSIEKVRRIAIAREPFTPDNGLLTPTLKIRRHKIKEIYGQKLQGLYR
ncbi:MAG TPA: AMP-binding protein, partial [Rhodospirillales bacterium]